MTIPRWRLALTAGALVVLGAVGGGFVLAAATSPTTPNAAAGADAAAASDTDGALLLDTLAPMSDPTSRGTAMPAQLLALRDRLAGRLANVRGHLVHGSLTVLDRDGKLVTYQLDHGTVSAIGSASITIAESGGSNVTVSTSSTTRVRKDAKRSSLADLKAGDDVVVRSAVVGGSATATLVVVLPASTTTAPPTGGNG
ncbi:MAG: hypothetical protein ACXW4H_06510 [Candidatus Limnocylindrales bacterium]